MSRSRRLHIGLVLAAILPSWQSTLTAQVAAVPTEASQSAVYTPGQIKAIGAQLAVRAAASGSATQTLGEPTVMLTYRNQSGGAEVHERFTDIFTIVDGSGTLELGGTVVAPKQSQPGETRGTALEQSTAQTLHPGDIVRIPAGTPHRIQLAPGGTILYFVVKLKEAGGK